MRIIRTCPHSKSKKKTYFTTAIGRVEINGTVATTSIVLAAADFLKLGEAKATGLTRGWYYAGFGLKFEFLKLLSL